jgi:hypothetical protein
VVIAWVFVGQGVREGPKVALSVGVNARLYRVGLITILESNVVNVVLTMGEGVPVVGILLETCPLSDPVVVCIPVFYR